MKVRINIGIGILSFEVVDNTPAIVRRCCIGVTVMCIGFILGLMQKWIPIPYVLTFAGLAVALSARFMPDQPRKKEQA